MRKTSSDVRAHTTFSSVFVFSSRHDLAARGDYIFDKPSGDQREGLGRSIKANRRDRRAESVTGAQKAIAARMESVTSFRSEGEQTNELPR